ncbi:MAG TPA: glutathione synthase, partial [Gammaproteobacteria bacterium]|nr:glutathione synthase [Gammaproteobacteria bacterium]
MTKKLIVLMDPIEKIKVHKDSTYALMREAESRGWLIYYMQLTDLILQNGMICAQTQQISFKEDDTNWYRYLSSKETAPLQSFDIFFMRKDPPITASYIYATQLLEMAQKQGLLVVNDPRALRDVNEKIFATRFKELCPETLITAKKNLIHDFLRDQKKVILKPLNGMGGDSIFFLERGNPNFHVIVDILTVQETVPIVVQRFLAGIKKGDKRIFIIDGKPYPYGLKRIPPKGEVRANLAAGGTGVGFALTKKDMQIADGLSETLKKLGLI